MAANWIKMRTDLQDDPTVAKVAEAIGDDDLTIIGRLHAFWSWIDKHAVDGHVDGATSRLVDKVSMKVGFADAMVSAGWLEISERGVSIPHFDRHNGESAKERGLKNARQARWRQKNDDDVDTSPTTQASTSPSTKASTRIDKRREEVKSIARARAKIPLPENFGISDNVRKWAGEKGHDRLDDHLESFIAKATAKGYTYANWDSAFMEAIRENWAKLPVSMNAANGAVIHAGPPGSTYVPGIGHVL